MIKFEKKTEPTEKKDDQYKKRVNQISKTVEENKRKTESSIHSDGHPTKQSKDTT